MMPVKLFELEPIQYSFTIHLPCISITICSINVCLCQAKVAKLGIEVEIHDDLQVCFLQVDPCVLQTAMNSYESRPFASLLACLPFILAPSSTSAKQRSCSSGHDGQREATCCEGNSPGTWPIRGESGGHCYWYLLVVGQFCSVGLQLVQQAIQWPVRTMPWLGQKWTDSPGWYALASWLAANQNKHKPCSTIQNTSAYTIAPATLLSQVTPSETWQGRDWGQNIKRRCCWSMSQLHLPHLLGNAVAPLLFDLQPTSKGKVKPRKTRICTWTSRGNRTRIVLSAPMIWLGLRKMQYKQRLLDKWSKMI